MEKETVNNIIENISVMYRKTKEEANSLSTEYDALLKEMTHADVTHVRYTELEEHTKVVAAEINNKFHVAQGMSDVREMLFELIK